MAQRVREFTTTALQAIAVRKIWPGPSDIQLAHHDKTHYEVKGQHHMNRVIAKIKAEGHLEILKIDEAESKGTFHKGKTEPDEELHITVAMKLAKALKCTCHWFMDGRVTYRKDGQKSDDLPPDITDKWIEREDAEEAAKAAAGEDSGGAP